MKKDLKTSKLYYGFPVIVLGYKDEQWGYNITTSSSSYTLGDMMVIGLFSGHNATKEIARYGAFTVNVPDKAIMAQVEQAGFVSHRDKLALTKLSYAMARHIDAPCLSACPLVLECQVVHQVSYGDYVNFIAKICRRQLDECLIKADAFHAPAFAPLLYMGDEKARIYRELDSNATALGDFLKQERRQKREQRRTEHD